MELRNLMESLYDIDSGIVESNKTIDKKSIIKEGIGWGDSDWGDELVEDLRLLIVKGQNLSTHAIIVIIEELISQYSIDESLEESAQEEERYDADVVIQALQDLDFENDDEYNYNQMLSARINQSFPNGVTATEIQELINEPKFGSYSSGAALLSNTFRSAGLDDLAINIRN